MNLKRCVGLILGAHAFWFSSLVLAASINRKEVATQLASAICAEPAQELSRKKFWELGIFDAQAEVQILQQARGLRVNAAQAQTYAKSMASASGHAGYASGVCADGRGFAASFPAPVGVSLDGSAVLLPVGALQKTCQESRIDFAPAKGGQPQSLPLRGGIVDMENLGDGLLTLSCQPKRSRWASPQLWYAIPVRSGPQDKVPVAEMLSAQDNSSHALFKWINKIRRGERLPLLLLDDGGVTEVAKNLAMGGALAHNRKTMRRQQALLAGRVGSVQLIGEDRVRGANLRDMAWLLWNSPRHRALLLDATATTIGISVQEDDHGSFAVVVTARGGA